MADTTISSSTAVRRGLEDFAERTAVDELMVVSAIFDHGARLRSYELLASVFEATPGDET